MAIRINSQIRDITKAAKKQYGIQAIRAVFKAIANNMYIRFQFMLDRTGA